MAELDIGKIKFTYKGPYSGGVAYEKEDIVYHDGSAWLMVAAGAQNVEPLVANSAYWQKIAQGSDLGAITGLAAGDMLYFDGNVYQRVPSGTDGQVLSHRSGVPAFETDLRLRKRTVYMPTTGATTVTESYNWYGNVYVDYTPEFATAGSGGKIVAKWDFQKGRVSGYGMLHSRYYENGVEMCKRAWAAENVDDSGVHFEWVHDGWDGQYRIGWQFRSYSSGHRPIIHAPYHFDGTAQYSFCQPQYVIEEWL